MSKSFKSDRTVRLFVDEATENLTALNSDLVTLEQGDADEECLRRIARVVHTLKGSSAMLGFNKTSELCHKFEDVFVNVRENYPQCRAEDLEAIFALVDAIQRLADQVAGTGEEGEVELASSREGRTTGETGRPAPPKPVAAAQPAKEDDGFFAEPGAGAKAPEGEEPSKQAEGRTHLLALLGPRFASMFDSLSRLAAEIEGKLAIEGQNLGGSGGLEGLAETAAALRRSAVAIGLPDLTCALTLSEWLMEAYREGRVAKKREAFNALCSWVALARLLLEKLVAGEESPAADASSLNVSVQSFCPSMLDDKSILTKDGAAEIFSRLDLPPRVAAAMSNFERLLAVRSRVQGNRLHWIKIVNQVEDKRSLARCAEQFKPLMEKGEVLTAIHLKGENEAGAEMWILYGAGLAADQIVARHAFLSKLPGFEMGEAGFKKSAAEAPQAQAEPKPEAQAAPEPKPTLEEKKEAPEAAQADEAKKEASQRKREPKSGPAVQFRQERIRVDAGKLDTLMNLVAELVINQNKMEKQIRELKLESMRFADVALEMRGIVKRSENDWEGMTIQNAIELAKRALGPGPADESLAGSENVGRIRRGLDRAEAREALELLLQSELNKQLSMAGAVSEMADIKAKLDDLHQEFQNDGATFSRVIEELQDETMKLRMLPVANVFQKFPRRVRDIAKSLNKKIEIRISGEDTELDKTLIEEIEEPMLHLIRNSIDHGIETADDRLKAGKEETGLIMLKAYHEGNSVVVEVADNGKGVDLDRVRAKAIEKGVRTKEELARMSDRETTELIFEPGFSTALQVSDLSGRGVGMDAVKAAIMRLKGLIEVESTPGQGCVFRMKLPLTLAIIQAMIVKANGCRYVIPMDFIENIEEADSSNVKHVDGQAAFKFEERIIPLLHLNAVYSLGESRAKRRSYPAVILRYSDKQFCLLVDEVIEKQQVVIKSLGDFLGDIRYVVGATIFGDGSIALILDVPSVAASLTKLSAAAKGQARLSTDDSRGSGLLVEESLTGRVVASELLEQLGFRVDVCSMASDALKRIPNGSYDFAVVDVRLTSMSGFEFVARAREAAGKSLPTILISDKVSVADRKKAFESGADDLLAKPLTAEKLDAALSRIMEGARL